MCAGNGKILLKNLQIWNLVTYFFVGDVELELGSVGNDDTFPFLLGFKFRTGIVATYLFVGNGAKLQYKDMDVVRQRLMEVKI